MNKVPRPKVRKKLSGNNKPDGAGGGVAAPTHLSGRNLVYWRYQHSAKGAATRERYRRTQKQLDTYLRYAKNDKGKERRRRYDTSKGGRMVRLLNRRQPNNLLRVKLYDASRNAR